MNTPNPSASKPQMTDEEFEAKYEGAPTLVRASLATGMAIIEATRHPTLDDDSKADIVRAALSFYKSTIVSETIEKLFDGAKECEEKNIRVSMLLASIGIANHSHAEKRREEFSNLMELLK